MNTRLISLTAIGLWAATVAILAYFFVVGSTVPATDGRQAITLNANEKDLILAEMRTMLASVQGVVEGIANQDMKRVALAARQSGSAAAAQIPAGLMAKLPLSFKQLGYDAHLGFDEIVIGAENDEPGDMLLVRLGERLNNCVACHATYRLEASVSE